MQNRMIERLCAVAFLSATAVFSPHQAAVAVVPGPGLSTAPQAGQGDGFGITESATGLSGSFGRPGLLRGEAVTYASWPLANVGGASLPARRMAVLVTAPGPIQLSIDVIESQPYPASLVPYVRALAPGIRMPGQDIRVEEAEPIHLPAAPVFVQSDGLARDRRIATLMISPVFVRDGEARIASSVQFKVNGVSYLYGDATSRSEVEKNRLAAIADFSTASDVGSGLARGGSQPTVLFCANNVPQPMQPFAASIANTALRSNIWRITVTTPGVQRLPISGLPSAPPDTYQIWRGGEQVPADVTSGQLRFYAPTVGDRFNAASTYWLAIGNGAGARMIDGTLALGVAARNTAYEQGTWRETTTYQTRWAGPVGDRWFAAALNTEGVVRDYDFTIANKLPVAGETWYSIDAVRRNRANTSISVGVIGSLGGPVTGAGMGNWTTPAVSVASGATNGRVHLNDPGPNQLDALYIQQVNWSRLVNLNFSGQGVRIFTPPGAQRYHLDGLPADAGVYDVTDPKQPKVVNLVGGDFQSAGNREYFVMVPGGAPQPTIAQYANWADLASPRLGNAVYIAPQGFFAPMDRLLGLRQTQGYKTQLVSVERIYDWFGTGDINAEAIRSFLRFANATWTVKPIAVTLVGDSSFDPFNRILVDWEKNGVKDFINNIYVPAYLADVDHSVGEADCDTCFVRWSCDDVYSPNGDTTAYDALPDAYVGRLSVTTAAQLNAVINKLVVYETSADNGAWRSRQKYFADNTDNAGSFANSNEGLIARQPGGTEIGRRNYVEGAPSKTYETNSPAQFEADVNTLLSQGEGIAVYSGHGNFPQWADPTLYYLDDADSINNNGQMPLLMEFTCATSWFDRPMPDGASLDEQFLRAPGAAIAVWGASGWDTIETHEQLATGFFDKLWSMSTAARSQPIGALINAGYLTLANSGALGGSLYTYILLGDPLTKLRISPQRGMPASIYMGTVAGDTNGSPGATDAIGASASFNSPTRVAVSPDGSYSIVADANNHTIRKINLNNGQVTTIAGVAGVAGAQGGAPGANHFSSPAGVAFSPDGRYAYVADTGNNAIRRIDLTNNSVTTLANGLAGPTGLAASWDGIALYFTEPSTHRVRRLLLSTNEVQEVAGAGYFNDPDGIALSGDGTFALVADAGNNTILRIGLATEPFQVATLAGTAGAPGANDANGAAARFNNPHGVALATDGRFAYVTDTGNNTIRRINLLTGDVSTVSGLAGSPGRQDGIGSTARYNQPIGIAMSPNESRLVVGDSNNNQVRSVGVIANARHIYLPSIKQQ